MRTIIAGIMVIALSVFSLPQGVQAQVTVTSIKKQLETVIFHAGELAQRGTAVTSALVHVQHSINCFEGTNGKNFKAAVGHVCQGQGGGIIPDLKAAEAAGVKGAERALRFVNAAYTVALQVIASTNVDEVQPFAKVIAENLKQALASL